MLDLQGNLILPYGANLRIQDFESKNRPNVAIKFSQKQEYNSQIEYPNEIGIGATRC